MISACSGAADRLAAAARARSRPRGCRRRPRRSWRCARSRPAPDADDVLDLLDHTLGLGRGQVDLVQHRHDLDALLDARVAVGDRLRLDALRRVDDEQRAFAAASERETSYAKSTCPACRSG
jgi:hypothetical protein